MRRERKWVTIAPDVIGGNRVRLYSKTDVRCLRTAVSKMGGKLTYRTESHRGLTSYLVEGI